MAKVTPNLYEVTLILYDDMKRGMENELRCRRMAVKDNWERKYDWWRKQEAPETRIILKTSTAGFYSQSRRQPDRRRRRPFFSGYILYLFCPHSN